MKQRTLIIRSIFWLIFIVVLGVSSRFVFPGKNNPLSGSEPTLSPLPTIPVDFILSPTGNLTYQSKKYLVQRVIDGDTIELEGGETVRYIGIDTPETKHPDKGVECFGEEAYQANSKLLENKYVTLAKDVSETDKYDRLLRYVYLDDLMVNEYLVREGFARASSYPPDVKYQDRFSAAEREAREANRGLWNSNACKVQGVQFNIQPSPSGDCTIKGNISFESKDKIYHLPSCPYYATTSINLDQGEKYFCSEAEAVQAGWRKAKNCP